MSDLYTDQMSSGVSGISTRARETTDQAKLKITVIDNEKIPYDESIKNVDRNLQNIIVATNDTLENVKSEYQKRIDDQNCRSDLFWRVIGIGTVTQNVGGGAGSQQVQVTLKCTKLAVTYPIEENVSTGTSVVGFSTNSMMWYTGGTGAGVSLPGITTVSMEANGDQLNSTGSAFDAYLEPDNLHGLLLYNEPYDRDLFELFVATGVGTISQGSNQLTLLTPNTNLGIKPGMVVTPNQLGVFASAQGNIVVGVSSTTMDLSTYSDIVNVGSAVTTSVPLITLQDPAIAGVVAPDSDGNYTSFDFSKDPDLIGDSYALDIEENPYVPQTIGLFTNNSYGRGVKIKYINNGASTSTQEWNKFLEGFPDPDLLPDEIVDVTEPVVGAGKIYYPIGFGQKPVNIGGGDASEGDQLVITGSTQFALNLYSNLSSCNDSDLNAAISVRDDAEAALSGSNSFPEKVSLVNTVRTKRNELNIAIWAYRTQIGDSDKKVVGNDDFMNTVNTSNYKSLMNTGTE